MGQPNVKLRPPKRARKRPQGYRPFLRVFVRPKPPNVESGGEVEIVFYGDNGDRAHVTLPAWSLDLTDLSDLVSRATREARYMPPEDKPREITPPDWLLAWRKRWGQDRIPRRGRARR